jgi:hypothetical protein
MKLRIIKFGPRGLDKRSFGFQHLAQVKIFYARLWFFGLYLALGKHDIAADFERLLAEKKATEFLYSVTNHKQRRVMEAMARKQNARRT